MTNVVTQGWFRNETIEIVEKNHSEGFTVLIKDGKATLYASIMDAVSHSVCLQGPKRVEATEDVLQLIYDKYENFEELFNSKDYWSIEERPVEEEEGERVYLAKGNKYTRNGDPTMYTTALFDAERRAFYFIEPKKNGSST